MNRRITLTSLIPVVSHELIECDYGVVTLEMVIHDGRISRWTLGRKIKSVDPPPVLSGSDPRDNV